MTQRDQSNCIGDRVRGYDRDYDQNYEGPIAEIRELRGGELFLIVDNELPGLFEGKRVGLADSEWRAVK